MDKRLKLLQSGGSVIDTSKGAKATNQKKWEAKAESKGYNAANDFFKKEVDGGEPYKRKKF